MNDDTAQILAFDASCGPDSTAHGLRDLEIQQIAMIEHFIAGTCSSEERRELSEFLQIRPAWIRWVADRVNMARETQDLHKQFPDG